MKWALAFAAALAGWGEDQAGKVPASRVTEQASIRYSVRFVITDQLEWRDALYSDMRYIEHQSGITVWSCDRTAVTKLLKEVQKAPRSNIVHAPYVVARQGDEAIVANQTKQYFVADLKRIADAPRNQASKVMFEPIVASVNQGPQMRLKGEWARTGTEVQASIDFCSVKFRNVLVRDFILKPDQERVGIASTIQVPEVRSSRAEGEWLIPDNGALIISMGTETIPMGRFKADVVEERIAVIEAERID